MDHDPYTISILRNTISTYIEWSVDNLVGSKWNSFNILGYPSILSWGFDIYGYSNPDDEQESVTILSAVNQTVIERTKPQIPVLDALTGFRRYRWQVTETDSDYLVITSIHMAYCKDPRYNDPNWTPVLTPTPIPTSTLIPTDAPTTVLPTSALTTVPPTIVPTTNPPTTIPPPTILPTILPPTTSNPTTLPPTTASPTTTIPTSLAPTTPIPPTQSPATPSPPVSYECTHQGYSLYLSHYSLKCSSDCDQYME